MRAMTAERRFYLAKLAFEIHSECSTIEDTPLKIRDAFDLEGLYPCLRKTRFERLQTARLETGETVLLEHEESCVNCGVVEPHFHEIGKELHCEGCHTLARANQIVHSGLDSIIESLVAEIPKCDWEELAWRIQVVFGGDPCPEGINWDCEPID